MNVQRAQRQIKAIQKKAERNGQQLRGRDLARINRVQGRAAKAAYQDLDNGRDSDYNEDRGDNYGDW